MNNLVEMKKKRFQFLNAIYEKTQGNEYQIVATKEIAESLKISRQESDLIVQYLSGQGLITLQGQDELIRITATLTIICHRFKDNLSPIINS